MKYLRRFNESDESLITEGLVKTSSLFIEWLKDALIELSLIHI